MAAKKKKKVPIEDYNYDDFTRELRALVIKYKYSVNAETMNDLFVSYICDGLAINNTADGLASFLVVMLSAWKNNRRESGKIDDAIRAHEDSSYHTHY